MNITVAGIASTPVLHAANSQGRVLLPTKGCYRLCSSISLLIGHDFSRTYSRTDQGLDVWIDDSIGVCFRAEVALDDAGAQVAAMVDGYCAVSVGHLNTQIRNEGGVEIITSTWVEEISLSAAGACPTAFAWRLGQKIDFLPAGLQLLAHRWMVSAQRRAFQSRRAAMARDVRPATPRPRGSPRPPLPDLRKYSALMNAPMRQGELMIVGHAAFRRGQA